MKVFKVFHLSDTSLAENYEVPINLNHFEGNLVDDTNYLINRLQAEQGLDFRETESDQPFYNTVKDFVNMPLRGQFHTFEDFAAVTFHELTHWTGHKSRLNRELTYGQEELVAELAALYVCTRYGFEKKIFESSLVYLDNWLKGVKEDPEYLLTTSGFSSKAVAFLFDEL